MHFQGLLASNYRLAAFFQSSLPSCHPYLNPFVENKHYHQRPFALTSSIVYYHLLIKTEYVSIDEIFLPPEHSVVARKFVDNLLCIVKSLLQSGKVLALRFSSRSRNPFSQVVTSRSAIVNG